MEDIGCIGRQGPEAGHWTSSTNSAPHTHHGEEGVGIAPEEGTYPVRTDCSHTQTTRRFTIVVVPALGSRLDTPSAAAQRVSVESFNNRARRTTVAAASALDRGRDCRVPGLPPILSRSPNITTTATVNAAGEDKGIAERGRGWGVEVELQATLRKGVSRERQEGRLSRGAVRRDRAVVEVWVRVQWRRVVEVWDSGRPRANDPNPSQTLG